MMSYLRAHLTYANVMATIAMFGVLAGGGAYAASKIGSDQIKRNAILAKHITAGEVTGKHVRDGSLVSGDFAAGQLPAGAQGPAGPQGPAGQQGSTGADGPAGGQGPAGSPDSGAEIIAKLATVDGDGSGLDADLLDGLSSSSFARASLFGHSNPSTGGSTSGPSDECLLGSVIAFAGNFAPRGYLAANGQTLPIATNQALFSLLGTTYGGNGSTNFALPNLRGAEPRGAGPEGVNYVICAGGIFPARP